MKKKNLILLIFGTLLILMFFWDYYSQYQVKEFGKITKGKVIGTKPSHGKAGTSIIYVYHVENIRYKGQAAVSKFECENGIEYFIGKEFDVYYSTRKPEISYIDLGKYQEYNNKIMFMKIKN